MKLKLSIEKLRLFIIFEILFENTEKKTTKCNYMQKHEMFFFHFFKFFKNYYASKCKLFEQVWMITTHQKQNEV